MASAQIVLFACVVGVGFAASVPNVYRGEFVPAGMVGCADTPDFQLDVFQTNYKCFLPFQGEVYDPRGPNVTCVCKVEQLCLYSKVGNDVVTTPPPGDGSGSGSGGSSGSALELTNPAAESGDSGSAPEPVAADESLADLDTYQYKCLNEDDSQAMVNQHNNPVA